MVLMHDLMLAIVIVTVELPIARATHLPASISLQRGEVTRLQSFTPNFKARAIYAFAYLAPPLLWSSARHKKVKLSIDVYVMNVHNYYVHCFWELVLYNIACACTSLPLPTAHIAIYSEVGLTSSATYDTFHARLRDMDCMCSLDDYEVRKRTMPQQTR